MITGGASGGADHGASGGGWRGADDHRRRIDHGTSGGGWLALGGASITRSAGIEWLALDGGSAHQIGTSGGGSRHIGRQRAPDRRALGTRSARIGHQIGQQKQKISAHGSHTIWRGTFGTVHGRRGGLCIKHKTKKARTLAGRSILRIWGGFSCDQSSR